MRNIIINHYGASLLPRHTTVSAEFRYPDGSYHRQDVSGGTPADALARALAWARRCMDVAEVEADAENLRRNLAEMAVWGTN